MIAAPANGSVRDGVAAIGTVLVVLGVGLMAGAAFGIWFGVGAALFIAGGIAVSVAVGLTIQSSDGEP